MFVAGISKLWVSAAGQFFVDKFSVDRNYLFGPFLKNWLILDTSGAAIFL